MISPPANTQLIFLTGPFYSSVTLVETAFLPTASFAGTAVFFATGFFVATGSHDLESMLLC